MFNVVAHRKQTVHTDWFMRQSQIVYFAILHHPSQTEDKQRTFMADSKLTEGRLSGVQFWFAVDNFRL